MPANSPANVDEQTTTRRGFFAVVTAALAGVPLLGGLIAALRSGLAPPHADTPPPIPLCRRDQVPADDVLVRSISYQIRRGPAVESVAKVVFVTRDDDGEILALSGECTHLSCPVQTRDVERGSGDAPLQCPCHGGKFSRTGEVLDGPPPKPLRRLRTQIPDGDDGMILLLET